MINKHQDGFSLTYDTYLNSVNKHEFDNFISKEGIWEYDFGSTEFFYNNGIVKLFGYSLKEIANTKNWWRNNLHPQDKKRVLSYLDDLLKSTKTLGLISYRFKCKNAFYKQINDHFFVVRDARKNNLRLIGTMQDQSEIETLQQGLEKIRKRYRITIVKAVFLAEERERKEISDELNENINQLMAAANFQLAQLKNYSKKEGLPFIENTQQFLKDAIAGIQKISKRLSPLLLKNLGFEIAMNDLLNKIPQHKNINYKIWVDDKASDTASYTVQTVLYRIAQQQIKNIVQHSGADFVEVNVLLVRKKIKMTIFNNGIGINPKSIQFANGFNDIQKKVEAFNGSFKIKTTASKPGFMITVII